jgi:hypothetical protein
VRRVVVSVGCLVLIAGVLAPAVRADPGDIDRSWGGDGAVDVTPGAKRTFAASAGGDRVFSWQFRSLGEADRSPEIRRHRANGTLDESFGDGGVARLAAPRAFFVLGVTNAADSIIVVGRAKEALVVARLDSYGRLDRSWNLDGFAFMAFASGAFVVDYDVHVAPDGAAQLFVRWLYPEYGGVGAHWYRFGALGRLLEDGHVEPDRRTVPIGAFAPNGDLVVLSFLNETRLVRYRSPGVRHTGFGDDGALRLACGRGLDIDTRGRILVICRTDEDNVYQLNRFDRFGAVDREFAGRGSVRVRTGGAIANFDQQGFGFDRDDRIVLWSRTGADHRKLWMGQLTRRGAWDRSFGNAGRTVIRRPGKIQDDLIGFPIGTLTATRFVVSWNVGSATELIAIERA